MQGNLAAVARALAFVLLALVLCGVIFQAAGFSAIEMFQSIADGAFLNPGAWQGSLRWAMPLFITACGVVVSFRSGYFNVGAQGQFYLGAIGATFVVDFLNGYPALLVVPLAFVAGVVCGGLWAAWPGYLRVTSGADEVITTLMGNFIASLLLIHVTGGVLKDPSGTGQVMASRPVAEAYRISSEVGLSPAILAITIVVGVLTWVLVNRTAFGVLCGLAGRNPTMVVWQGAKMSELRPRCLLAFRRARRPRRRYRSAGSEWTARQRLSADSRLHGDPDRARRRAFGRGGGGRLALFWRARVGELILACAGGLARRRDRHHQRRDRALHHRSRSAGPRAASPAAARGGRRVMEEFIVATLRYGTPLVYVTLAGVLAQRAGVWNLGLEGLMIIGCCASVLGFVQTGSLIFGFGLAIVLCVLASALLWFVVEKLRANPIIAGLGLTGLGLGGTDLAVQAVYGSQATVNAPYGLPRLGPAFGAFGVLSILVVAMPFVVFLTWVVLRRTRFGLQLAACGEHPFAARSVGADPSMIRLIALCAGGVLCALGGTELALGSLTIFAYGMTAGRGFMAFSAVIFGAGHPLASVAAAFFFSIVGAIGIRAQLLFGDRVPNDLLLALPYIATVFGVWISARLRGGGATSGFGELRDY